MSGLAPDGVAVGRRVVLRVALDDDDPGRSQGFTVTDVVGDLVAADASTLVVATRRGERTVARASVVAAKELPPAPPRRRPRGTRAGGADTGSTGADG